LIPPNEQTIYRSGVGMLMYLVKHSRPDLSNAVRELTKILDVAAPAHWKALIHVVKYVLDTKLLALKLQPKFKLDKSFILEGFSDSEFAGDRETRASVYGFITFFCGAPISWKSKSNKSVTLSSTEAEYYASSETAKELMFIKNIIAGMRLEDNIKLLMSLRVDNPCAIYLANNQTTGQRTKHIDIRTHFVRNMINDGLVKTVFVKSEENAADIFTKNVSEKLFNTHINKYMIDLKAEAHHTLLSFEDIEEEDEYDYCDY
jgi:hypothetical protein